MNRMNAFLIIIALALTASSLAGCRGDEHAHGTEAHAPIAVSVASAAEVDTFEPLEAGGVVAARESATLSSRIVATIAAVRVKAGDRVRAGDVLVSLDARDVTERTRQARASAVAAEQTLSQVRFDQHAAEADHQLAAAWQKRIAALHARNAATDQERDEADARLASAAARLDGAQAGIELATAQLAAARAGIAVASATESFGTVRAPFDGVITERLTDPGNLAAPGVPLLRIESDGARQVVVRVDEARAAYVHPGDHVRVVLRSNEERTATDEGVEGVVAEIARAVEANQRAFAVKIDLPQGVTARSGSFARAVFRGAARRALLVPASAVQRRGQVTTVFVVRDGLAQLRLVQVGASTADGTEVLTGVDAGESIVTAPAPGLTDGSRVVPSAVGHSGGRQ